MKEYHNLKETNAEISKELKRLENKLIGLELNNRNLNTRISKMMILLTKVGYTKDKIDKIIEDSESDDNEPKEEKDKSTE